MSEKLKTIRFVQDISLDLKKLTAELQLGADGIYYSAASEAVSYPEAGNEACFQIEEQAFWFRHRNNCTRDLVKNFPPRGHFGWHIRERVSDLKCIKMFAML